MIQKLQIKLSELEALIEVIQQLYFRISSLLLERRMDRTSLGRGEVSGINVAEQLRTQIDMFTAQRASKVGNTLDQSDVIPPGEIGIAGTARIAEKGIVTTGRRISNGLATWMKQRGGLPEIEPHMAEKLKASAVEHIHQALRLARHGKFEAAKIHADLAESAVKTAARYMPKHAYRDFENQIRERLDSIIR